MATRRMQRQRELLPHMPDAVGQPWKRPHHSIAVGSQRGQAPRHLARQPFDAADLGTGRSASVYGDRRRWLAPRCDSHRVFTVARRSTIPPPIRPIPTTTMSHPSRPVKASSPRLLRLLSVPALKLEEAADPVVEGAELDVVGVAELDGAGALVGVDDGADLDRLPECDELDGCEPAEPPPFAQASGSTYCWSPAETPGHDAADVTAGTDRPSTPMTPSQARLSRHLRTAAVSQSLECCRPRVERHHAWFRHSVT